MDKLVKIKRMKLGAEIENAIKDFIKKNKLTKGAKLPSERELTVRLGVGRSSLREALKSLESLGVLRIVPGKGMFVDVDSAYIDNKFSPNVDVLDEITNEKITLLELLDIRVILESYSAKMAAINASEEQIKKIEEKLAVIEELYSDNIESRKDDVEFHNAIHEASCNPIVMLLFKTIYGLWVSYDPNTEHAFSQVFPLHRPIFKAISDHNPEKAEAAVREMLELTKKIIQKWNPK